MKLRDWSFTGVTDLNWHGRLLRRYARPLGARPFAFLQAYRGSGVWHGGFGILRLSALPMPYLSLFPGVKSFQGAGESQGEPRAVPRDLEPSFPRPVRQVMATRFGLAPAEATTSTSEAGQQQDVHPQESVAEASWIGEVERPGEEIAQATSEGGGSPAAGEDGQAAPDRGAVDKSPGETGPRSMGLAPPVGRLPLLMELKSRWQRGRGVLRPVQTVSPTSAGREMVRQVSAKEPRFGEQAQQASPPGKASVPAAAPGRLQPSSDAHESPTVREPVLPEAGEVRSFEPDRVIPEVKTSATPSGRGREHGVTSGAAGGAPQFSRKPSILGGGPGEMLPVRGEFSSPSPAGAEKRLGAEASRPMEGDSGRWRHPPSQPAETGKPSPPSKREGSGAVMARRPMGEISPILSALRVESQSLFPQPSTSGGGPGGIRPNQPYRVFPPPAGGGKGEGDSTGRSHPPPYLPPWKGGGSPRSHGETPGWRGFPDAARSAGGASLSSVGEPEGGRPGGLVGEVLRRWASGHGVEETERKNVPLTRWMRPPEAEEGVAQAGLEAEIRAATPLSADGAQAREWGGDEIPEMPLRAEHGGGRRGNGRGSPRERTGGSGGPLAMPLQRAPAEGTLAGGSPGATPTGDTAPGAPGEVNSVAEAVRTELPDLERIAGEVYAILERRLIMERESRGL